MKKANARIGKKCKCDLCAKWSPLHRRIMAKLRGKDKKLFDEFLMMVWNDSDNLGAATGKLMQDEVVAVVRKLARLKCCADQLNVIVEGVKNKRWAADGCRLKDTMEWCHFYCALSEANAPELSHGEEKKL